jgi:hypothetical protein
VENGIAHVVAESLDRSPRFTSQRGPILENFLIGIPKIAARPEHNEAKWELLDEINSAFATHHTRREDPHVLLRGMWHCRPVL